jgi:cysteinyl-tRNA synthetase
MLKVFNSLSGKKEEFVPLHGKKVNIYSCGPTVYDLSHLGHARNCLVFDIVNRYLRYLGYDVTFVRNITDIDDKIINRAKEQGISPEKLARKYTYTFWRDMERLNVMSPDVEPRATEYLLEMQTFIQQLIDKGHAYVSHGDVYFDVTSFKEYGKLKKQNLDEMMSGAREQVVSQDELAKRKKHQFDFVLWKSAPEDEAGWPSPWGHGRPGWNPECSVMNKAVIGETIDIHCGGEDLLFPHHENEIAQSEALHGKPFARYWLHNGMLVINGEKMSKSLGNFSTIDSLLETYSAETIRLFVLQTHYRSPLEFSDEGLQGARAGLSRLVRAVNSVSEEEAQSVLGDNCTDFDQNEFAEKVFGDTQNKFNEAMSNDFNTAASLAVLFKLADIIFQTKNVKIRLILIHALQLHAEVLGLTLEDDSKKMNNEQAEGLMALVLRLRQDARQRKDFATSDLIRDELTKYGIKVMDTPQGACWEVG